MKTQMKCQKILVLVSLIFAALTLVYSFFFVGGMLYEISFYTSEHYFVGGAKELHEYAQSANNTLVIMSIVLILCVVLNYIANSNKRRNYYVTNYIAIAVLVAFTVACSITFIVIMAKAFTLCGQVDVNAWYEHYTFVDRRGVRPRPQHYSTSKISLIFGIILAVLMLVMAAAWILNTVWKIKLMQGEKALLKQSNEMVEEVA